MIIKIEKTEFLFQQVFSKFNNQRNKLIFGCIIEHFLFSNTENFDFELPYSILVYLLVQIIKGLIRISNGKISSEVLAKTKDYIRKKEFYKERIYKK